MLACLKTKYHASKTNYGNPCYEIDVIFEGSASDAGLGREERIASARKYQEPS